MYSSIINKEYKPIFKITMKKENWGKCEVMPFPQKISGYEIYANFNVKIRNYTLNKLWCLIENISDLQEFYLYNKLSPEAFSEGFFYPGYLNFLKLFMMYFSCCMIYTVASDWNGCLNNIFTLYHVLRIFNCTSCNFWINGHKFIMGY